MRKVRSLVVVAGLLCLSMILVGCVPTMGPSKDLDKQVHGTFVDYHVNSDWTESTSDNWTTYQISDEKGVAERVAISEYATDQAKYSPEEFFAAEQKRLEGKVNDLSAEIHGPSAEGGYYTTITVITYTKDMELADGSVAPVKVMENQVFISDGLHDVEVSYYHEGDGKPDKAQDFLNGIEFFV